MHSVRALLLTSTLAPPPFYLCEDLRRHIHFLSSRVVCQRCGALVVTRRRVNVCFLRSERLCFVCYQRARWPRM